jgi:hypothetical protein
VDESGGLAGLWFTRTRVRIILIPPALEPELRVTLQRKGVGNGRKASASTMIQRPPARSGYGATG